MLRSWLIRIRTRGSWLPWKPAKECKVFWDPYEGSWTFWCCNLLNRWHLAIFRNSELEEQLLVDGSLACRALE